MYFSMARAFNITKRRRLQKVLEAAKKDWKCKNHEVKKIDKVRIVI